MIDKVGKPEAVAADAAYQTPAITSYLFNKEITPAFPNLLSFGQNFKGNFKRGSEFFNSNPFCLQTEA